MFGGSSRGLAGRGGGVIEAGHSLQSSPRLLLTWTVFTIWIRDAAKLNLVGCHSTSVTNYCLTDNEHVTTQQHVVTLLIHTSFSSQSHYHSRSQWNVRQALGPPASSCEAAALLQLYKGEDMPRPLASCWLPEVTRFHLALRGAPLHSKADRERTITRNNIDNCPIHEGNTDNGSGTSRHLQYFFSPASWSYLAPLF